MRKLLTIIVLLLSFGSYASTNYYISNSGSDANNGTSTSTPWATLSKVNSALFVAGDSVLFNKGDIFYGQLGQLNNPLGTLNNPIIISSYGIGANPKISGFTQLSSWVNSSGNIYYASIPTPITSLNMVTIDGQVKGMGRYPNTGYLPYQSHTNNTSITSSSLTGTPNWTGAEVVIRKLRWIIDRAKISSQSSGTLNYIADNSYGNSNAYTPVDGNGFFIQNNLQTLDQDGEWYFDSTNQRLYVYYTGGLSSKTVKISTVPTTCYVNTFSYINFKGIDFEGSNNTGIYLTSSASRYIKFLNCNLDYSGGDGIYGISSKRVVIDGCTINRSLNGGMRFETQVDSATINNNKVTNSGFIVGAMRSGDSQGSGITLVGDSSVVTNNVVINSGFNNIAVNGNNFFVYQNYVDSSCIIKDDGGGIYTYSGQGGTIRKNIVLHGIGAYPGAEAYNYEAFGKAAGIYIDDGETVHRLKIDSNTVAFGQWSGIFHSNGYDTITNNKVFDYSTIISFSQDGVGLARGNALTNNIFIAKTILQTVYNFILYSADTASAFGKFNNNVVSKPIDESTAIDVNLSYSGGGADHFMSLAGWKNSYFQDSNSTISPKAVLDTSYFRFEYNTTSLNKTITLDQTYISVSGNVYSSTITLLPFTSIILIKSPIYFLKSGNKILKTTTGKLLISPNKFNTASAVINDGNTVGWYLSNASSTITKDGSNKVSQWNDSLGSGNNLTASSSDFTPTWTPNGISFNGVANMMKGIFTLNQPTMIYIIASIDSSNDYNWLFSGSSTSTGINAYNFATPHHPKLYMSSGSNVGYPNFLINTPFFLKLNFSGTSSFITMNTNPQISGNAGTNNMGGITLAAAGAYSGNLKCIIKEVIIRKVTDISPNSDLIYNYLKNKYGL